MFVCMRVWARVCEFGGGGGVMMIVCVCWGLGVLRRVGVGRNLMLVGMCWIQTDAGRQHVLDTNLCWLGFVGYKLMLVGIC